MEDEGGGENSHERTGVKDTFGCAGRDLSASDSGNTDVEVRSVHGVGCMTVRTRSMMSRADIPGFRRARWDLEHRRIVQA
jgi:hypothetical protein